MTYEYDPDMVRVFVGAQPGETFIYSTDCIRPLETDLARVRWLMTDDNEQEIVDGDAPDRPPEPTDPQDDETPRNDEVPE